MVLKTWDQMSAIEVNPGRDTLKNMKRFLRCGNMEKFLHRGSVEGCTKPLLGIKHHKRFLRHGSMEKSYTVEV